MATAKRVLIAGAAVAAVGMATVGSVGLASAATSTSSDSTSGSSLVDKIAAKFNLNKSDVQAVVDQDRSEHQAEMKQQQADRLAQAVKDGKLTQAQADYITKAQADIEALMANGKPGDQDDTVRQQVKTKMDALRTWAQQNKVDMSYVGPMMGHGRGPGGPAPDQSSTDDSSTSTNDTSAQQG